MNNFHTRTTVCKRTIQYAHTHTHTLMIINYVKELYSILYYTHTHTYKCTRTIYSKRNKYKEFRCKNPLNPFSDMVSLLLNPPLDVVHC